METSEIKKRLKKVEVVYADVDGTFVTHGCLFMNTIGYTLNNAKAVFDLLTTGVDIVMTTSRTKEQLQGIARVLGFRNYICDMGCEIVYNNGKKILKNYGSDVKNDKELKDWIHATGVTESLFNRYKDKVRYYIPWSNNVKTHPLLVGELDFVEVSRWFNKNFPSLRIVDNGLVPPEKDFKSPHAYHILPKDVGKKTAVRIDKKQRGLKKENLIGIGDSAEDLSIASEVGVYFMLDDIAVDAENVFHIKNDDGNGFSRVIQILSHAGLILCFLSQCISFNTLFCDI